MKINFSQLEIRERLFLVAGSLGTIMGIIGGFINLYLDFPIIHTILIFFMSVFSVYCIISAVKKNQYALYSELVLAALCIALYPSVWISSGGSNGPVGFLYIFNFMLIGVLLNGSKAVRAFILSFMSMVALILNEHLNPASIHPYSGPQARFLDYSVFAVIVSIFAFYLAYKMMEEYSLKIKALHNTQAKLEFLSNTDTLSGISNRRYIMNSIENCLDQKETTTLIMFDIDNFKSINDTYGHTVGDTVIRQVANTLSENIRSSDFVGRIGGEEFMVVLKNASKDKGPLIADSLREKISNLKWAEIEYPVTVSIGVYHSLETDSLNSALEKVDRCLYKAKESGKNKVITFDHHYFEEELV